MKPKTFNDTLALVLSVGIPGLWVASRWVNVPGEALGATIAVFTLVAQFYFRKAPPNGNGSAPP